MKRILVTGSRTWTDRRSIQQALEQAALDAMTQARRVVIVHGAAGGADAIAGAWARMQHADGWPVTEEPHPARWTTGRSAGMDRNRQMVALGADLCLAFIRDNSPGASACAEMARRAGIPTVVIGWERRDDPQLTPP